MLWLVRRGNADEEQALRTASATAADLADAALLTARLGAARLYRRRLLRAHVARTLAVAPEHVVIERLEGGGQRIVAPRSMFASVSARGDWTAIATSNHPVGVDIETRPTEQPLPLNLLHPREQAALDCLSRAAREKTFLRFWTAREAYLKAKGRGLPGDLAGVEARDDAAGEGVLLIESGVVCARIAMTLTDDFVAAVVELRAPE